MIACRRQHGFHILNIAESDHAGQLMARHRDDERLGTGRQQQAVVTQFDTGARTHDAAMPIDAHHRIASVQLDAVLPIPLRRIEHDVVHALVARQQRRQQDAVVIAVRLGAEHGDVVQVRRQLEQLFHRAHASHAIADHRQRRLFGDRRLSGGGFHVHTPTQTLPSLMRAG